MEILYQDKSIIVCVKEPGLVSQEGRPAEATVPGRLSAELAARGEQPWIFVVHRLDKDTGGVMVYARNKYAAASLAGQAAGREMKKEYLAVVRGCPAEPSGQYRDLLFRDMTKNKSFVVRRERKGVKEALLEYEVLESARLSGDLFSLIRVRLQTGRTHQIRVQFASRQMPLLGDSKYGGRSEARMRISKPDGGESPASEQAQGLKGSTSAAGERTPEPVGCGLSLWAWSLEFRHPDSGKLMCFKKLPPAVFPWTEFQMPL